MNTVRNSGSVHLSKTKQSMAKSSMTVLPRLLLWVVLQKVYTIMKCVQLMHPLPMAVYTTNQPYTVKLLTTMVMSFWMEPENLIL